MRSRNFTIGLVASVVVVALAVGCLFLVRSIAGPDLELPDEVDGLVASDLAAAYPDGRAPDKALDRQRSANAFNSDGFSAAFDGAEADTRTYIDTGADDFETVAVIAVAGRAGPLVPDQGFVDPAYVGFALPQYERVTRGDVECILVRSNPPRAGTDFQPDQAVPDYHVCQRPSGDLTVRVTWRTGDTDRVVDLVDTLWDELD
ncbi:hypothetical protein [Nocardioides sp.]|uniref:hypothetical protein n=1 Tax=Nocardioides sp. TaxID=35761 RepID=UPI0027231B85|nr:hypothetical protein [Nocardioides sp.]MDO9455655.1 hypothetical protein [Nocardioides sp.]